MVDISFLKKIAFPKFDFSFGRERTRFVGIDIGSDAAKVVQLKKDKERAVLETYGELKTANYFKQAASSAGGVMRFLDQDVAGMLQDVLRESNVTTRQAVLGIPSVSSFITIIDFPLMNREEVDAAIPIEAKRYVPTPLAEITMDWEIVETDEEAKRVKVLLAVVPNDVVSKYRRIAEIAKIEISAVEIESFSLVRSLLGRERGVAAIVNIGAQSTAITIADNRIIRLNSNVGRGSREITMMLARSLSIDTERAEAMKREVGFSTKPEEKEISDVITQAADALFNEIERIFSVYNRSHERKIERVVLSGGGASLAGFVDYAAQRTGLETALGNPFSMTVYPALMQPILKEAGPGFGIAVGLALRQIASW